MTISFGGDGVPPRERALSADVLAAAEEARVELLRRARIDPVTFCEYTLRAEKTGRRIHLAPMHVEQQRAITEHKRLIIWGSIESAKTTTVTIGRTLFELGKNPALRTLIVSNGIDTAKKITRTCMRYIESSKELREVFPHLRPATPWTTDSLTVERPFIAKDPSIQAIGVRGHYTSARIDRLILDDILDYENTRTAAQRREVIEWIFSSVFGRLTDEAIVTIVGNAYYRDDLLHILAEKHGYKWLRYPVADAEGRPLMPDLWSPTRIAKAEKDLGGKGSPEALRQLFCVTRSDESARCKEEWVQACLARGLDKRVFHRISEQQLRLNGGTTHAGVDIGVKRHSRADKTTVFTILNHPSGDRQVLNVRSGKWSGPQIIQEIQHARVAFLSTVHVESNGAQDFILQFAHLAASIEAELAVLPFNTGMNKLHPLFGVESIFVELAQGKWIIPSREHPTRRGYYVGATPEIETWIGEMLEYSPNGHTGDLLMGSWFAREGARLQATEPQGVGVRIIGENISDDGLEISSPSEDPDREMWGAILGARRRAEDNYYDSIREDALERRRPRGPF